MTWHYSKASNVCARLLWKLCFSHYFSMSKGVPPLTDLTLTKLFHWQYGNITFLIVSSKKKGSALVEFETPESAVSLPFSFH